VSSLAALTVSVAAADVVVRPFEQDAPGVPPPGFSFAAARQATPGRWMVGIDAHNRFLAHAPDAGAAGGLSLALLDGPAPARLRASVRVKLAGGERAGGLVWRYEDDENFYVAALDLGRQEIALYRVVRGNRIKLEEEDDLELDHEAWHTVRVVHEGDRIRVALGGIGVMRVRDRALTEGGRVGVWSGGAAASAFDDLRIEEEGEDRR
jgi:hypothetical protein